MRPYIWTGKDLEHRIICEKALGRQLKGTEEVHHLDGDGTNNHPDNLVICPNHTYHMLLHSRTYALAACGKPDWKMCGICKSYDAPENLSIYSKGNGNVIQHKSCRAKYVRDRRHALKSK